MHRKRGNNEDNRGDEGKYLKYLKCLKYLPCLPAGRKYLKLLIQKSTIIRILITNRLNQFIIQNS